MDTLQAIISAARQQESWNVTHEWNYGLENAVRAAIECNNLPPMIEAA